MTLHSVISEEIPRVDELGPDGARTLSACVAGSLQNTRALEPPPDSWAADVQADIAIWTIKMEPGARWMLPPAIGRSTRRKLYFFKGKELDIAGRATSAGVAVELRASDAVELANGHEESELLLLQGRPIDETVAQYGPFVMNTEAEVRQAFADYRRTAFGGWPWPDSGPVHGPSKSRFARHADGRIEQRGAPAAP